MVQNGLKWFYFVHNVTKFSNLVIMDKNDPEMVPNGHKWSNWVKYGPKPSKIVKQNNGMIEIWK